MRPEQAFDPRCADSSLALFAASNCNPPSRCPPTGSDRLLGGRYRLRGLIGSGAMGNVYQGFDERRGRHCAIKMLNTPSGCSKDDYQRFANEAATVAKLRHPNVVQVSDFSHDSNGRPFIVMELLTGVDLHSHLQICGRLPLVQVQEMVGQIAAALNYAHQLGIIHRDIKPRNIFLSRPLGAGGAANAIEVVKVVDFGLSKRLSSSVRHTAHGIILGTPEYLSPEATLGRSQEVDAHTDQWALAITAYRMLSGVLPFKSDDIVQTLLKIRQDTPLPIAQLAPGLPDYASSAITRAMSKRKQDRFASIQDFARAFCGMSEASEQERQGRLFHARNQATQGPSWMVGASAVQAALLAKPQLEQTRQIESNLLDGLLASSEEDGKDPGATAVYEERHLQSLGIAQANLPKPHVAVSFELTALPPSWRGPMALGVIFFLLALSLTCLPIKEADWAQAASGLKVFGLFDGMFRQRVPASLTPPQASGAPGPTVGAAMGSSLPDLVPAAAAAKDASTARRAGTAALGSIAVPHAARSRAPRPRISSPHDQSVADANKPDFILDPLAVKATAEPGAARPQPRAEASSATRDVQLAAMHPGPTIASPLRSPLAGTAHAADTAPVSLRRIAGADPHLPVFIRSYMKGQQLVCSYLICIEPSGKVGLVRTLHGLPQGDDQIIATLLEWRYLPIATRTCRQQEFKFEIIP